MKTNHDDVTDAVRRLSTPDDDPAGMNRRRFLQAMAFGAGAGAVLSAADAMLLGGLLPGEIGESWGASTLGPDDGILITVFAFGGNDGLNTLVPYNDADYYRYRGRLAVPADQVLALDGAVGLHPNLRYLKGLYDEGKVAVVQGVGYPSPDLSHFNSMATWMRGHSGTGPPTDGWIGRWLDGFSDDDPFRAVTIGSSVPLHLQGVRRRATGIPDVKGIFGAGTDPQEVRMFDAVREFSASSSGYGVWHDLWAATARAQLQIGATVEPLLESPLPDGPLSSKMVLAARLINAGLGIRVVDMGWGDFDSHSGQPSMHPARMSEFDDALAALFTNLDETWRSRVTVLFVSEFGRTAWANGSDGTDHGAASVSFVISSKAAGGLHGQHPSLAGKNRWGNLDHTVDFRSVYASVLSSVLGADPAPILGGSFQGLSLFDSVPGVVGPSPAQIPAVAGDFVALSPERILDTRSGVGGRSTPVEAPQQIDFSVTGVGGVPTSGVTAVALNLTAANPTAGSYFTLWPAGEPRPLASNLNWRQGAAAANLVVTRVGAGGRVSLWTESGRVDAIADVVGYFGTSGGSRFLPLSPVRLLDTRSGVGAPAAPLGQGETIPVTVVGVPGSGVPATGVDAVAINVTVDQPTKWSYLTVWPTDETRPDASSVTFDAGQTVPNLVIAKVGSLGRISLYNQFGSANVIGDVVGCFTSAASGRHVAVAPTRVLDTRDPSRGVGRIDSTGAALRIAGVAGVPDGAVAVVMNVTVTDPDTGSYLTVWPTGEAMPTVSSLNYLARSTVANLVIVKLGNGSVNLANARGSTHAIADVVGYFV